MKGNFEWEGLIGYDSARHKPLGICVNHVRNVIVNNKHSLYVTASLVYKVLKNFLNGNSFNIRLRIHVQRQLASSR